MAANRVETFFWTFAICLCVVAGGLNVQAIELAAGQQESNQSTLNVCRVDRTDDGRCSTTD